MEVLAPLVILLREELGPRFPVLGRALPSAGTDAGLALGVVLSIDPPATADAPVLQLPVGGPSREVTGVVGR